MDKKTFGIWAIIAYVLSLPILIWKSSKVGRLVFVFVLIGIVGYAITTLSTAGMEAYFKVSVRQKADKAVKEVDQHSKKMYVKLEMVEYNLTKTDRRLSTINLDLNKRLRDKIDETISDKQYALAKIEQRVQELNQSLDVIQEEQRDAIKDRLLTLREQIKIEQRSVDSKETRAELEVVAANIELLTKDEQKRLYDDLAEIGFGIEEEDKNITWVSDENMRFASGASVSAWYR